VPGQPAGVTLLHVAAGLPLPSAAAALQSLWALAAAAPNPPTGTDAFVSGWFAGPQPGSGSLFDAPSQLLRASIAASAAAGGPGVAEAATVAAALDRLCLLRLAAGYVRSHNVTSPLEHCQLPGSGDEADEEVASQVVARSPAQAPRSLLPAPARNAGPHGPLATGPEPSTPLVTPAPLVLRSPPPRATSA
jgi:hypothetical protein